MTTFYQRQNNQTLIRALISINELSFRRLLPWTSNIPTHSKLWNDDTGNLLFFSYNMNFFLVIFLFLFLLCIGIYYILTSSFLRLTPTPTINCYASFLCSFFYFLTVFFFCSFLSFAFFPKIYRSYETKEPSK